MRITAQYLREWLNLADAFLPVWPESAHSAAITASGQQTTSREPHTLDTDWHMLGGDSLDAIRAAALLTGRVVPLSVTAAQLLHARSMRAVVKEPSLPRAVEHPSSPHPLAQPLFLLHPIDGNVDCYRDLAELLVGRYACYGLPAEIAMSDPPPTVSTPDSACEAVSAMAAQYVQHIRVIQPHGPYVVAGWGFAAAPGFAVACCLEAAGETVRLILLHPTPAGTSHGRINATALTATLLDALLDVPLDKTAADITAAAARVLAGPADRRADLLVDHVAGGDSAIAHTVRMVLHHHEILAHWQPVGLVEHLHLVYPSEADIPDEAGRWSPFGRTVHTTSLDTDAHLMLHDPAALADVARILNGQPTRNDNDPGGAKRGS